MTAATQQLESQTLEARRQDSEWHHAQCLDELHTSVEREDRAARDLQEAARNLTLVQWDKDQMEQYYVTLARESVSQTHRQEWLQDAQAGMQAQPRESHDQSDQESNVGTTTHVDKNVKPTNLERLDIHGGLKENSTFKQFKQTFSCCYNSSLVCRVFLKSSSWSLTTKSCLSFRTLSSLTTATWLAARTLKSLCNS